MAPPMKADWIAIEGEYRAGKKSLREIADDHGISDTAVRKKAKASGWMRDPTGAKRERVKAIMAGHGSEKGSQFAAQTIEEEAGRDASDMTSGLEVARACIARLCEMVPLCDNPRDVKVVAEANKIAVETIRRIRGLDDVQAVSAEIVIDRSYGGGV